MAQAGSYLNLRCTFAGGAGAMSHGGSGGHKRSLPSSAIGSSKRQNLNIFAPHGVLFAVFVTCVHALLCTVPFWLTLQQSSCTACFLFATQSLLNDTMTMTQPSPIADAHLVLSALINFI